MLKSISKSLFGEVFFISINSQDCFFLKFFNNKEKCFLNNYVISPLFARKRAECCAYSNELFSRNNTLKKYYPELTYYSRRHNFVITKDQINNKTNFDALIRNGNNFFWLKKIRSLTNDFISTKIKIIKIPVFFKNNGILRLKTNLQIRMPLLKIFTKQKVNALIKSLGKAEYLCHGDLQPKNVIFGNRQTRVVDLDETVVGYSGLDAGFLWGNIIYLVSKNPKELKKVIASWRISVKQTTDKKVSNNFKIITVATILMRIFLFPLQRTKPEMKKMLINFCSKEL